MEERSSRRTSLAFRVAWITVFALSTVMAILGLWVISAPVDPATFQDMTRMSWSSFSSSSPEVAAYLEREVRLLGANHFGASVLAMAVTWVWLRTGDRRATPVLLIFPLTLALTAALLFMGSVVGIGAFYAASAVLIAAAVVFADRTHAAEKNQWQE